MTLRFSGTPGRALVHVEVPRADELPVGVPAPAAARLSTAPTEPAARRAPPPEHRPFRDPALAAEAGRKGALAKAAKAKQLKVLEGLGLRDAVGGELGPYLSNAEEFAVAECQRLAQVVGGGVCGSAPSSIVQSAALALAASRYLYSKGEVTSAARLAESSRQHLLAAHELCAREAKAREATEPENDIERLKRRLASSNN